jgi:anti-sigma factor RsiW
VSTRPGLAPSLPPAAMRAQIRWMGRRRRHPSWRLVALAAAFGILAGFPLGAAAWLLWG